MGISVTEVVLACWIGASLVALGWLIWDYGRIWQAMADLFKEKR